MRTQLEKKGKRENKGKDEKHRQSRHTAERVVGNACAKRPVRKRQRMRDIEARSNARKHANSAIILKRQVLHQ